MTQYSQQNKKNVFHVKKRTFWGELFQPCVANYTYTLNYINYIYCNNWIYYLYVVNYLVLYSLYKYQNSWKQNDLNNRKFISLQTILTNNKSCVKSLEKFISLKSILDLNINRSRSQHLVWKAQILTQIFLSCINRRNTDIESEDKNTRPCNAVPCKILPHWWSFTMTQIRLRLRDQEADYSSI